MSHKDGRVVLLRQRSEARAALQRIAALMQCEPDDDDDLVEAVRLLVSERNEARAEVKRLQERVATQDDGLRYGEQVCARLVSERDKLRAERRQLRARLVECLPFVGVCPLEPNRIQWMQLVRDLADDTLAEVQP